MHAVLDPNYRQTSLDVVTSPSCWDRVVSFTRSNVITKQECRSKMMHHEKIAAALTAALIDKTTSANALKKVLQNAEAIQKMMSMDKQVQKILSVLLDKQNPHRRFMVDTLTHICDVYAALKDHQGKPEDAGSFVDNCKGTIDTSGRLKTAVDMSLPPDIVVIVGSINNMTKREKYYANYAYDYVEKGQVQKTARNGKKKNLAQPLQVQGCYATEKFDGVRARWNPPEKQRPGYFEIGKRKPYAIREPPAAWQAQMSKFDIMADGELWPGRGQFYTHKSALASLDWKGLVYVVFDSHDPRIAHKEYKERQADICRAIKKIRTPNPKVRQPAHATLSTDGKQATRDLLELVRNVSAVNGEGIVLKPPMSSYYDSGIVKVKILQEAEAEITEIKKEFVASGTSKVVCKIKGATGYKQGVSVMGVPTDIAKEGTTIVIGYTGVGSKGGIMHARYERVSSA